MAERSYPFVHEAGSTGTAGATTDAEYSQMFRRVFETGVVGTAAGSELRTYANSTGLNVKVPGGQAFVRGHFYSSNDQKTLLIAVGDTAPRIDSVILRMEYAGVNDIHLEVRKGTPSSSPTPAALIQTETGVFELLLATVAVGAGASTITAGDVVDQRAFTGIRPVSGGGTGASTPAGARTALGITPGNIGASPSGHEHYYIQNAGQSWQMDAAGNCFLYNGSSIVWNIGADGNLNGGMIPWGRLTGIPGSFNPGGHVHDIGDIAHSSYNNGGRNGFWQGYLPDNYAAKSHQHNYVDILVPGTGNIFDWVIRDFAAKSHSHDDRYYTESEINDRVDNLRPTHTEFERSHSSDAQFAVGGPVDLVSGVIGNARAGMYLIKGFMSLYSNADAGGWAYVTVNGQREIFRNDLSRVPMTFYAETTFWHGGGNLTINAGYWVARGTPAVTGKSSGRTKVSATFLGA